MDYVSPVEALFPGTAASVISALARTERPLTIRQLAERAQVSHPQAGRHVERLESLGVVAREVVGRSHLVHLTPSAAGDLLRRLDRLGDEVLQHLRITAPQLLPNAVSVVVFGSFARGRAVAGSDIDVAVIAEDPTDEVWLERLDRWVDGVAAVAGNPVAEIVVSADDLPAKVGDPVWKSIAAEGIALAGRSVGELLEQAIAGTKG